MIQLSTSSKWGCRNDIDIETIKVVGLDGVSILCLPDSKETWIWVSVPLQLFLESFWGVRWTNRLFPTQSRKHVKWNWQLIFLNSRLKIIQRQSCRYFPTLVLLIMWVTVTHGVSVGARVDPSLSFPSWRLTLFSVRLSVLAESSLCNVSAS